MSTINDAVLQFQFTHKPRLHVQQLATQTMAGNRNDKYVHVGCDQLFVFPKTLQFRSLLQSLFAARTPHVHG